MIVLCIHFNLLTRESRTNIWLPWHWIMDENLINTLHVPISWCTIIHISFHFLNNISYFNYVSDCHWFGSLYVSVRPAFYYLAFFLKVLLRCTQISEYYFLFVGFSHEFSYKTSYTLIFQVLELEHLWRKFYWYMIVIVYLDGILAISH